MNNYVSKAVAVLIFTSIRLSPIYSSTSPPVPCFPSTPFRAISLRFLHLSVWAHRTGPSCLRFTTSATPQAVAKSSNASHSSQLVAASVPPSRNARMSSATIPHIASRSAALKLEFVAEVPVSRSSVMRGLKDTTKVADPGGDSAPL